ncbi:MAG: molybdopterin molybdotransferase MoeA [Elusimicrobia bacterium]|nr:molybdopterin molybdotransferase MoeA [Elusimicrobiota bacterium]
MLAYADALAKLRGAARARGVLPEEEVALHSALGRVAARAVFSREPVPPFDNSAMDGYALAAAKAAAAPARLTVLGTVLAGDAPRCAVESGGAWRIMTGAPLPAGCDAVVPVEKTREKDGAVEIQEAPEPGDFVRGAGSDFPAGAEACAAGTRLGARHLLALAAVGVTRVPVRRRPRVALIATGRELTAPGEPLKPGRIRDASSVYLAAALPALGADFANLGVVADDPADFRGRLLKAMGDGADLVLTTGAVSMGTADFIPATLKELGAETVFHKTAIRPGKPVFVAKFPKGPLFIGLPGNPISTVVGLRFFVEPVLRDWLGRPEERPLRSVLKNDVPKPEGLRCFFKGKRHDDGVEVLPAQASFQIHSLLNADCWVVLDETGDLVKAGTAVECFPLVEPLA